MPTEYSRKNKERLRKETYEMYQNLSEEEKNLKRKHGSERYKNFSEE